MTKAKQSLLNGLKKLTIPPIFMPLFDPASRRFRFWALPGGRGSSKSWTAILYCILRCMQGPERVLMTRQTQVSLRASNWQTAVDWIKRLGVENDWAITESVLTCKSTGSTILFFGIGGVEGEGKIRSTEGLTIVHVDEAQQLDLPALSALTPTLRTKGALCIFTLNPTKATDPVYERYVATKREDTLCLHSTYLENPFLDEAVKNEAEYDRINSPDYDHKWLGALVSHSEASVLLGKYTITDFDAAAIEAMPGSRVAYGLDFGFSRSPQACVRVIWQPKAMQLWVTHESFRTGVDKDQIAASLIRDMPADVLTRKIYCDAADPPAVSAMRKDGLRAEAPKKYKIENGIRWLRSLRKDVGIMCHTSCKRTAEELRMYSHKIDPKTNEIKDDLIDNFNHAIDAIRYLGVGVGAYSDTISTSLTTWENMAKFSIGPGMTRTLTDDAAKEMDEHEKAQFFDVTRPIGSRSPFDQPPSSPADLPPPTRTVLLPAEPGRIRIVPARGAPYDPATPRS